MYTRNAPYLSKIKERYLLNGPNSTKKTYHVVLEAAEGLDYRVGDSIGVIPTNDPNLVHSLLQHFKTDDASFREYLTHKANLHRWRKGVSLFEIPPMPPVEVCKLLLPLLPRFYSIASSLKVFPHEVHLTVAEVKYTENGQTRYGVGSHFLCEMAELHKTPVPIYVQPSNHFTIPSDPGVDMIMVGPGTGVAPFRAFLQERIATQSMGRNWLFFGERNRASDYYYADYWQDLEKQGRLRLDLAFSRDQADKIYVQHRMLEERKSLWAWLQQGAYIYVCGDAQRMAKDVDAALQTIAQSEGKMGEEDARLFIKSLRAEKRYLIDVY